MFGLWFELVAIVYGLIAFVWGLALRVSVFSFSGLVDLVFVVVVCCFGGLSMYFGCVGLLYLWVSVAADLALVFVVVL